MNLQSPWEPNRLLQNSPHSGPTSHNFYFMSSSFVYSKKYAERIMDSVLFYGSQCHSQRDYFKQHVQMCHSSVQSCNAAIPLRKSQSHPMTGGVASLAPTAAPNANTSYPRLLALGILSWLENSPPCTYSPGFCFNITFLFYFKCPPLPIPFYPVLLFLF